MNPTNPPMRPDPRTATAEALIAYGIVTASRQRVPRDIYSVHAAVLERIVRDLVQARDEARRAT